MQIHLIRHAHAGSRAAWDEADDGRPLSPRGEAQARIVCEALADAGIDALWSSRYTRCRQTLEPLGERLGLPVQDVDSLAEGGWGNDALDELLAAAADGRTVAACSHGDVIPAIVATAVRRGASLIGPGSPKKSARYVLEVADGEVRRIVHVDAPDGIT